MRTEDSKQEEMMQAPQHCGELQLSSYKDKRVLFCYLDEAGDFNFSPSGSAYYLYTAVVTKDPFPLHDDMLESRYTLRFNNLCFSKSHEKNDYFHATEDALLTRKLVFETLKRHLKEFRIYSIVVQKNKMKEESRDSKVFFQKIMKELIEDIVSTEDVIVNYDHICILADRIPVQRKSAAIIGPLKKSLKSRLGPKIGYSLSTVDSKSDLGLQAADYCCWSLFRFWERGETESRDSIAPSIAHEIDFLEDEKILYY